MDETFPLLARLGVLVVSSTVTDARGHEVKVVRVNRAEFAAKISPLVRVRSGSEFMPALQAEKIAYEALQPIR